MSQYAALGTTCMACTVRMRGTKAQSPQTNGICERFRKMILKEFYSVALLKKTLDAWIDSYNHDARIKARCAVGECRWQRSKTATNLQREVDLVTSPDRLNRRIRITVRSARD